MKTSFKELMERYGLVAVVVYLTTSLLVGIPAFIAIKMGFELDSAAETSGTFLATFVVLKATQIPRLAFTAVATPFVARYVTLPMPGLGTEEADAEATPAVETPDEAPTGPVPEPETT